MNKAILIGRLGQDPEMRYTKLGMAVCNISLATSKKWKKDGEQQEKTEWHKVNFWDKQAEAINKYCTKGSRLAIEGEIETRSWEDSDGVKKYSTEIRAYSFEFLSPKSENSNPQKVTGDKFNQEPPEDDLPF